MDSLFPTLKIYTPHGQHVHVGRPRADAVLQGGRRTGRSCTRASTRPARWRPSPPSGTSYATHGEPMIPIYIFYSMFGFQRTGDALLGGRRPDGPRLRARRHRRAHHAERRGPAARGRPLAAARRRPTRPSWPTTRRSASRSATSSGTACAGCTARTRRTSSTTSRSTTSRSCSRPSRTDVDVDGLLRGHVPLRAGATDGDGPQRAAARVRRRGAVGAARRSGCSREDWGVAGRRLVGDVLERAAPRRARGRRAQPPRTRTTSRAVPYVDPAARRARRARSSRCRTSCARCRT